ncbi:hypothetical protein IFM89_022728 [Coptis chinensis]|uniref:non-specific serine/threonine protein kinase n=1 Tax=Coptis chinensis TaxID=261450 RepID=A0A835IF90_9MAGN|nr:hypothetical protein IFM89_022728 [Coptis chinensis]
MKSPGTHWSSKKQSLEERSDFSSVSSSSSTSRKSTSGFKTAAKSVAVAFTSCFTPPETKSSSSFGESEPPSWLRQLSTMIKIIHTFPFLVSFMSDVSSAGSDRKRSSRRGIYTSSYNSTQTTEPGTLKFTMPEIYKATKNFAPSFKIGQGGFGTVYKGRLDDGTLVAVKRAKKNVYDKHLGVEFQSEIKMLARVEHLNLVRFHGYLEHEDEKIVVVEYVPNGTLRERLDCLDGNILDLAARLDIAIDVAHAVTYLHMYTGTDHPIIHRDIKSSNILLTENLRAKVADFGFARLAADSDTGATHVSTQVKGTAGYLDPEYLRTYQLTEKSDVYSFGVLLVELVSGRRPIEPKRELKERITTRWAMKKFTDGEGILTLDPMLLRNPSTNLAVEKILELALQCLAPTRQGRPSMRRCAEILWGVRKDFRELSASDLRSLSSLSQRSISIIED